MNTNVPAGSALPGQDFTAFYRRFSQEILVFLARRTLDPDVAFELTAETFARAFASRRRFRGETEREAQAWLYRIAEREFAMWGRRGRAERRALTRLGVDIDDLSEADYRRVEELADLRALRGELGRAMRALAPGQIEALHLRVVEELSYDDVARRLAISEEAARTRVSRGLRSLAAALETSSTVTGRG